MTPAIAAALLLAAAPAAAQSDRIETEASRAGMEQANVVVSVDQLPPPVLATLRSEAGDAPLVERERNPRENLYLFRAAASGGRTLFLIVEPDGDLRVRSRELTVERGSLPLDVLPVLARETVEAALAAAPGRVVEATEDLKDDAVTGYEAEIAFADGRIRWFAFAPDGRTLDTREERAWNMDTR